MQESITKYFVLVLSVFIMLMNYSCKKNTTSSDNGSNGGTEYPQINVKVADTNIPTETGSYDFGEVNVGETSTAVSFTIENLGDATLNLDGTPPVEISGTDSDLFSVTQQPGNMIDAGNTTTTSITFSPISEGAKTATVLISNNDSDNSPYTFTLDGSGTEYPQINVKVADTNIPTETGSYDFGEVNVGETSTVVSFTIENLGYATLNLDGTPPVEISGTDSDLFSVTQQPGIMIDAGNTTSTSITFSPTSEGAKTATVLISNNDSDNSPYTFTLDGIGINPFILDYVGDWDGQWTNTTFNTTGAAYLEVTADTQQKTVQFIIDVDGFVLGGSDPDPITLGGTYSDTGINISSTVNTFGDLTLTIDSEGNISGTAVNVPNQFIEKIDFTGTATPEIMTINYTVTFTASGGGGTAVGVFILNKI